MVRKSVPGLGIRWTIGDVSEPGREVLRFSILGAWKVFGPSASYVVCVNSCDADGLRRSLGELPQAVRWMQVPAMNPAFLPFCDASLSEGTAWKFSPVRCFPDRHELALDNDVVLWRCPPAVRRWLSQPSAFLLGADVVPANGSFSDLTGPVALNSGIRGFPPGFDYEARLLETLRQTGRTLRAELDEQGLQVAVMTSSGVCHVVSLEDVTICSPFQPHVAYLGRCGAHFVGLNARSLPWNYYGRPATECRLEHWCLHRAPVGNLVTRRARRTTVTRRPQRVGRARRKSS
ncbi:MAG: hypothetical protein JO069_11510, partial [Verrucomicrobia bacterium]|nr:hypothetical protein [Verrucomicrobiota bacterium]